MCGEVDPHGDKICAMTCCPCHIDLEKLKSLVNAPQYICSACGRVANEEKNLCEPKPLN